MSIVGRRVSLIATLFALGVACTASENVRIERDGAVSGNTGSAGDDPSGAGGTGAGEGTAGESASSGSAGSGTAGFGSAGYPGTSTGAAAQGGRSGTAGAGGTHVDAGAGSAGASGGQAGATGSDADPMEAMYGSYATFIGPLLMLRCAGCHLGTQIQGGFVIGYPGITAHVSSANSGCSGLDASKLRVVPGKSANSLVYIKTNDVSPPAGCGGHMPYQVTSLPPDEQQLIHDWILAGARP